MEDLSWRQGAPCTRPGVDPDVFFPGVGGSYEQARELCHGCVVRPLCLAWVLRKDRELGVQPGMFGGLTPAERRKLAKRAGRRPGRPAVDAATVRAVRRLAADRLTDREIGRRLDLTGKQVSGIRRRNGIPAGQPQQWHGARSVA